MSERGKDKRDMTDLMNSSQEDVGYHNGREGRRNGRHHEIWYGRNSSP
jgi:hypothetical protein